MKIVFRADASPDIGGGHIMRCMTLADELLKRGHKCSLVTNSTSFEVFPRLNQNRVKIIDTKEFSFQSAIDLGKLNADLLVIDHYGLGTETETQARKVAPVAVFDDAPSRQHDCDLLLDPTFGRKPSDYRNFIPAGTQVLCQPDYALIKPAFSHLRLGSIRRKMTNEIRRISVCFGATDLFDYSEKVALLLAEHFPRMQIDVVTGSSVGTKHTISKKYADHPTINWHVDPQNLPELMSTADFAIGSAGTMSWERCCLALASIAVPLVDNQRDIAQALSQTRSAITIISEPDHVVDEVVAAINTVFNDKTERQRLSACAAAICDGRGVFRAADIFEELALKSMPSSPNGFFLRSAKSADSDVIWAWRNDALTRAVSENSTPVLWSEHHGWFEKAINDRNCLMLIACHQRSKEPLGIIRFNKQDEHSAIVSINLAPHARGKGAGGYVLTKGCTQLFEQWDVLSIVAMILESNAASIHLFEAAGFRKVGQKAAFTRFELTHRSLRH